MKKLREKTSLAMSQELLSQDVLDKLTKDNGVIFYARYSSENQSEDSIDSQLQACYLYAEKHSLVVLGVYYDEACTGQNANRPDLIKLKEDIYKTKVPVKYLLVFDNTHLSRDMVDTALMYEYFWSKNIIIQSVGEQLKYSGKFMLDSIVNAYMGSEYIENLRANVKRGHKLNATYANFNGGVPPLGYKLESDPNNSSKKRYVVDEEEAVIVILIFTMYVDGYSYNDIFKVLNSNGYKTKQGKYFGKNSLFSILSNEKYIGNYVYNRAFPRDRNGKRKAGNKDESEIVRVINAIPAIIEKELWDKAQLRKRQRSTGGSATAKNRYLLSGLVVCGCCECKMSGNTRRPAKDRDPISGYRCNRKERTNQCTNSEINRDILEKFVIQQIIITLNNKTLIRELTKSVNDSIKAKLIESNKDNLLEEKKLTKLEKQRDNIINAIALNGLNDSFQRKLSEIESDIKQIEALPKPKEKKVVPLATESVILSKIENLDKLLENEDIHIAKNLIKQYVEKVVVYPHKIIVTFKVAIILFNSTNSFIKAYTKTYDKDMLVA